MLPYTGLSPFYADSAVRLYLNTKIEIKIEDNPGSNGSGFVQV